MTPRSPSLGLRALLALGLMVGFYGLAPGMAIVLIWLPYAEVTYAHRIHPKLALICLVGAAIILWSILPRRDRFRAPGPPLRATRPCSRARPARWIRSPSSRRW